MASKAEVRGGKAEAPKEQPFYKLPNPNNKGENRGKDPTKVSKWNQMKNKAYSTMSNFYDDTHPTHPVVGIGGHGKKVGKGKVAVKKTRAIADDLPVTPDADFILRPSDLKNENMVHSGMLGASASEGRAKSKLDKLKPHTK